LPQAQADKVFAMLAVFDRAECRSAAAEHFEMPDLPAMMALAFSERPSLKVHLAMADFGHVNPRWRAGLVSAMDAYALHRCTDEFLATMIENENEWLPNHVGAGAYDAYGNAQPYYYRAAVFNRMLHAPERLDFWLRTDWVLSYCDTARDRETRRFAEQWSRSPGQSARPSRASGTHCGSR
jgi:hypothetical protein